VFPWFGIDIGGTLVKLVYFEPLDLSKEEETKEGETLRTIRHYLIGNTAYGDSGIRDVHLELKSIKIGDRVGNLHFIRFPTNQMELFIDLCVTRKLHTLTFQVFATGGGAFKFESVVKERLNIEWIKCDELDMLIQGIEFLNKINSDRECYFFEIEPISSIISNNNSNSNNNCNDLSETSSISSSSTSSSSDDYNISLTESKFIKKNFNFSNSYPYIVVNIGSGVSILLVKSESKYKRISGTSIGGGTFLGLCCLLTGCSTYEEAIDLATRGDNHKVDKLVKDIYGGDYSRFALPGNIVASR
jgi:type II pantothenate kinase